MFSFRNMHLLQFTTEKNFAAIFRNLHHNMRNQGINI